MRHLLNLLLLLTLFSSFSSEASSCTVLSQNSSAIVSTKNTTKCIEFRAINYSKTYFTADPSFQSNAAYNLSIKDDSGRTILDTLQKATGSSTNLKLNTYYTTIKVYLKPVTHNTNYEFFVVHDENTSTDETVIYIGLNSEYEKPFIEPRPCSGCQIQSIPVGMLSSDFSELTDRYNTMSASSSDASQCTDANRPPEAPPVRRDSSAILNINGVLRESHKWSERMRRTYSTTASIAGTYARLFAMHKVGGALDVAHDPQSDYVGSFEMGNFLYGANGRAMGLPDWMLIRGAAAYQAISHYGYTWEGFSQGIVNFVENNGDNSGDPQQTIRGIRYHDEVFILNMDDESSTSCNDMKSESESGSTGGSGIGGGGEGGNTGGGTGGDGSIIIGGGGGGGGTGYCFEQKGFPTYCWIE